MIGTAYFDASGKKESAVLVVAGFLSPTLAWIEFERAWVLCLSNYGVTKLHMKDFAHNRGEFLSWGDDESRRQMFLGELIAIIKAHANNSFASAVHMEDFSEVDKLFCLHEWAHPYAIAGAHCIAKVKSWAEQFGYAFSLIDCVFEDGDEGKGDLVRISSKYLGLTPTFKKKDEIVVFQAADLIAYEHHKSNRQVLKGEANSVGFEDLRIPFQLLASIPGSLQWGVVQKADLIRTCQGYGVPLR